MLPSGIAGELVIGGANIALGYWNDLDTAGHTFLAEPIFEDTGRTYRTGDFARFRSDGCLEFLGRTDRQLKIRGFRVETAEIERVLADHPMVIEAVVVPAYHRVSQDDIVARLEHMDPEDVERLLSEVERVEVA